MTTPKTALPEEILTRCRELRKNATDAERLLWLLLRNRQLGNAKFRRQHPCAGYILDFYCHEAHLGIEVDGGGHLEEDQIRYDQERTTALSAEGIHVLRFWNHDVLARTQEVLEVIWEAVGGSEQNPSPLRDPHPGPLPRGEGVRLPSPGGETAEDERSPGNES